MLKLAPVKLEHQRGMTKPGEPGVHRRTGYLVDQLHHPGPLTEQTVDDGRQNGAHHQVAKGKGGRGEVADAATTFSSDDLCSSKAGGVTATEWKNRPKTGHEVIKNWRPVAANAAAAAADAVVGVISIVVAGSSTAVARYGHVKKLTEALKKHHSGVGSFG